MMPRRLWDKTIETRDALDQALRRLGHAGGRTPCQDPATSEQWTSEDQADRELAAAACAGCPVLALCHEAAEIQEERWHVWGGRDWTRKTRARRTAAA